MIDDLTALRLQIEWGADEAIGEIAPDRFHPPPTRPLLAAATTAAPAGAPLLPAAARAQAAADAAPDLAALAAALVRFDGCGLRDTAGATVFADGPEDAALVLVIEAPDAADDESGRPLSGEAGRALDRMLEAAGIARASCRVATLVPWRPPGGRPASPGEIASVLPFLRRHLALLRPRHAVLFGAGAARAVLGVSGSVRQLRGTFHPLPAAIDGKPREALIMLPPALLMTDAKARKHTWNDLLSLRERSDMIPSA